MRVTSVAGVRQTCPKLSRNRYRLPECERAGRCRNWPEPRLTMPQSAASAAIGAALAQRLAEPARCEHFLHVFPSFGIGGVPLRMVRVINHFGSRLHHSIVALDRNFAAACGIAGNIEAALLPFAGSKSGIVRTLHAIRLLRRLRPDLLITYNWGAIEWAMANRLLPVARQIHFEAGFGKEEADRQIRRRVLFRRWALARCEQVVVPSRGLEDLARRVWKLPPGQVAYIPNGSMSSALPNPVRDAVAGFARRPGELVVGTRRAVAAREEYRAAAARLCPPRRRAPGAADRRRRRRRAAGADAARRRARHRRAGGLYRPRRP